MPPPPALPPPSSATYSVSTPDGRFCRSNITNPYGLAPIVGMPFSDMAALVIVGVPNPIENTFVNAPVLDVPYSWLPKMPRQRVLLGVATTCISPVVAPRWLYQMPPFALVAAAPEIHRSTPSSVTALRTLSPLSPVLNTVVVLTVPAT